MPGGRDLQGRGKVREKEPLILKACTKLYRNPKTKSTAATKCFSHSRQSDLTGPKAKTKTKNSSFRAIKWHSTRALNRFTHTCSNGRRIHGWLAPQAEASTLHQWGNIACAISIYGRATLSLHAGIPTDWHSSKVKIVYKGICSLWTLQKRIFIRCPAESNRGGIVYI